jgi:hypothetical protein
MGGGRGRREWAVVTVVTVCAVLGHCAAAVVASAGATAPRVLHLHPVTRRSNFTVPGNFSSLSIEYLNHELYGGLYSQQLGGESFEEAATQAPQEAEYGDEKVANRDIGV